MSRILLRCPVCRREKTIPCERTDYPETVRVESVCPSCDTGDFDEEMQFDAEGQHIIRDPEMTGTGIKKKSERT